MFQYNLKGFKEFRKAIENNPQVVKDELGIFLPRAIAVFKGLIWNYPWRMGGKGGGVPVATGNLRDTHRTDIRNWEAKIYPTAPYAGYVHGEDDLSFNVRGVQLRPWLSYAFERGETQVRELEGDLLEKIVVKLAS
jgi:hypothetical protein